MDQLRDLIAPLADQPALAELRAALTLGDAPLRVAPLMSAARPVLIAVLAAAHQGPLLIVTSSGDSANRLAEDLQTYLGQARSVLRFPAIDALPYEHMQPSPELVGRRIAALQALSAGSAPLIVAPLRALLQPTLSQADFAAARREVAIGTLLAPDDLLRHLIAVGYRSAPAVTESGEFARRGGIIDLWPAGSDLPLRIEWFDDEIESLRRFDPHSQRSEERIERAWIGPPTELPIHRREAALERARYAQITALRTEVRSEWEQALAALAASESPEGLGFLSPFFLDPDGYHNACLSSHLPSNGLILLYEGALLRQQADEIARHAEEQRLRLIELAELPPDFPRPYLTWDEAIAPRRGPRIIDLTTGETPPIGPDPLFPALGVRLLPPPTNFRQPELFGGRMAQLVADVVERLSRDERVALITSQAARLLELISEQAVPAARSNLLCLHAALDGGWQAHDLGITVYSDSEIFGWRQRRTSGRRKARRTGNEREAFLRGLQPGDYVVHIEHGIAAYEGLIHRTVGEIEREYLVLRYAAGDKIYVPVDQVDRVNRYIGAGDGAPTLTRLGTQDWERAKRKARAAVEDLAEELIALYAKRRASQGFAFSPDSEWQRELEDAFPYSETEDQLHAIADVKQDMEQSSPMDRLVCGDVGFGKTEVAIRAAFKAVQDGRQVAVLVPTTVLAQQHFDTFRKRMAAFPITVEVLSRFRSPREQREVASAVTRGKVDILIGTHRILSQDISFKQLGLVIVDEEQRFGVRHKERLKQLRAEVDVLTLTATPIPRTLHMAMAGIRDLSVIDTPPEDRVPIRTFVVPRNDELLREALLRELERDGQVYFVHNRVHSIYQAATELQKLVPEARIGIGHGQMAERDLEQVMLDFFEGHHQILVCTTIIESGLDVPNANTIVIDDATNYGLAQLYQLRGRVGRSAARAYAYLLYHPQRKLSEEARARLEAIQEATELGAGFKVAMRDLEIRGAGNLLGAEQSGHIAAVGFDLYSRLLEQAVKQLKSGQRMDARPADDAEAPTPTVEANTAPRRTKATDNGAAMQPLINEKILVAPLVTLDLPLTAYLPASYIADERVRLEVYQRMTEARTVEEVRSLRATLQDRFASPPREALDLLLWLEIKALALAAGVSSIITTNEEFTIRLPILDLGAQERLRRRYPRDQRVRIGPQFIRLERRGIGEAWSTRLIEILTVIAGSQVG